MEAIANLRTVGYVVEAKGDKLHLKYVGSGLPNAPIVRSLVTQLRERKRDALEFLRTEPKSAPAGGSELQDVSPALAAAMAHPAYRPGLPIWQQTEEVEELWAKETFAALGCPDPGREAPR